MVVKQTRSISFDIIPTKCYKIGFAVEELFPDWKIQEKWISITLRGRPVLYFQKQISIMILILNKNVFDF